MSLRTLAANVVYDLPEDVGEESVVPFSSRLIQGAVQIILVHCFRIDDVGNALDAFEAFQSCHKDVPGVRFATARWTDHHEPVLNLLDLIELQNLGYPTRPGDKLPFTADVLDVATQLIKVAGYV